MKAHETKLLTLLQGPKQFVIPIYQRTYSWTRKQCAQLLRDICRAGGDPDVKAHFIGSVVYIQHGLLHASLIQPWLVIDGQQRMTAISLLIASLAARVEMTGVVLNDEATAKRLRNYYLLNSDEDGDRRFKLLLTRADRDTLMRAIDEPQLPKEGSRRILENAEFFRAQLAEMNVETLRAVYHGITKLVIVDVSLDHQYVNPQLIFESLNSTGLELTQADLIRNYVLMGLEPKQQEKLYGDHWHPMKQDFGTEDYAESFDRFMRDYLTVKMGRIPNIREVYAEFKTYANGKTGDAIVQVVADIHKFAKFYARIALGAERDKELHQALRDIRTLKVEVAYPFLLEVLDDHAQGMMSQEDVVQIVRMVESYVFRRAICDIATNTMNKTFATLAKAVDKKDYVSSLGSVMALKSSKTRFPTDGEFRAKLLVRNVYDFRNRDYLLRKLEHHDRKEMVPMSEYTIEHVLPQNPKLSAEWQSVLGERWKDIQDRYLHTLGNLTLTRYNSELSDRPFKDKRDMKGGFRDSPVRLNHSLAKLEEWSEAAIVSRGETLAELAVKVWSFAALPAEVIAKVGKPPTPVVETLYTLADHPKIKGKMLEVFKAFRERTVALGLDVREHVLKRYVAFKSETNFVDIVPKTHFLRLMLNMPFASIDDPKGICEDATGKGLWGNGNVMIRLKSVEQLDDVMSLVKQSYQFRAK